MTRPFSFVRLYSNAPRKPFPLTNLAIIRFVSPQCAPVASVTLPPSVAAKTHRPRSLRNLRSLCARSDSGSQQGGQAQRSAPYSRAERAEKEAGAKEQPRAAIVQASCSFAPPSDAGRRTHPTKPARRWSSHEARRVHLWGDLLCASWLDFLCPILNIQPTGYAAKSLILCHERGTDRHSMRRDHHV